MTRAFTRVAHGGRIATTTLSAIFFNRTSYAVRLMMSLNSELIAAYDDTLRSLIDIHAPYRRMRRSNRWCWFDAENRAAKRTARSLERAYRRQPSAERCLLGSPSLARNVISFSEGRPNAGQLRLRVVRVTHGSCGTRLTKSSRRRLHPSSN